ncbi:hypothetical protein HK096_009770, partial [Nowakowskiella sp. JEL0078]
MKQKRDAWRALREAIRHNFENYQIWQNYMYTSVDLGEFSEVMRSMKRILELRWDKTLNKETVVDIEILNILIDAISKDMVDADGAGSSRHISQFTKLLSSITAKISTFPPIFETASRFHKIIGDYRASIDDLVKSYRIHVHSPALTTDSEVFKKTANSAINLVEAYVNLGQLKLEGGEIVCADWKYQAKMVLKGLIGKTKRLQIIVDPIEIGKAIRLEILEKRAKAFIFNLESHFSTTVRESMGISGLLPLLKSIQREINLKDWAAQILSQQSPPSNSVKVAVDASVDVSPEMALELIKFHYALRIAGVDYIVAPYEADAQLAYLERNNFVSAVITEDSDLLVFGCRRVLFKLEADGTGIEINLSDLHKIPEFRGWTHEKFRQMCILSGCDYLSSPEGFGIKTALKSLASKKSIENLFLYWNWGAAVKAPKLCEDYHRLFKLSELAFQHQLIYDPIQKDLRPLNPYPEDWEEFEGVAEFLGPKLPCGIAHGIAIADMNPITKLPFDGIMLKNLDYLGKEDREFLSNLIPEETLFEESKLQ